jgi:hypothetical protein
MDDRWRAGIGLVAEEQIAGGDSAFELVEYSLPDEG